MNAYKLANAICTVGNYYTEPEDEVLISNVSTMLCQQADQLADQQTTINFLEAECAALRKQINEA